MTETVRVLSRVRPDVPITIIGATLDDIALMRNTSAFVTGAVAPDEFEQLVAALGVTCLFISTVRPLFFHPILSIVSSLSIPIAYFDWSMGCDKVRKNDLAIHPGTSLEDLVDGLKQWIPCNAANSMSIDQ
jgi:hypothetical protein